jgi:hypothetical protein
LYPRKTFQGKNCNREKFTGVNCQKKTAWGKTSTWKNCCKIVFVGLKLQFGWTKLNFDELKMHFVVLKMYSVGLNYILSDDKVKIHTFSASKESLHRPITSFCFAEIVDLDEYLTENFRESCLFQE